MWTKWLLVLGLTLSANAAFSGLQNDLDSGYSYRQPEEVTLTTIPASLAYYINIPAGQSHVDYYYLLSNNYNNNNNYPSQYNAVSAVQDSGSAYRQQQYAYNQDLGYNRQQQPETTRVSIYRSYSSNDQPQQTFTIQSLPATKIASDFAPASANGYQVEPRSRLNQQTANPGSPFAPHLGRNVPRPDIHQDHRDHSAPTQELISPSSAYSTRDTSQFESKGFGGSAAKQNYRSAPATASLPSSYNAQLPFAIGAVPIKFKPFPLKTHLRQSGLLPITSYQARESYKK